MQQAAEHRSWHNMGDAEWLAALRFAETRLWLCEGRGGVDRATLVVGWSAMVRLLAQECAAHETPCTAFAEAESWLLRDPEEWSFGPDGTACRIVTFGDGGGAATLVTDDTAVAVTSKARH